MGIKKINDLDDAQEEINALRVVVKREQAAREKAENLLENRASHLFNINQRLHEQYVSASKKNQEIDYLLKITKLEAKDNEIRSLLLNFLEISSMLLWTEYSFAFKLDKESKKIIPITSYIISQNPEDQKDTETQFVKEDFSLLDIFADEKKLTIFSNFKSDIKKINSNYSRLNHSYLFPVEVDSHDKFFIWLTFANIVDLDQRTVDLVDRGISQLKG
ncbi:MAG: hypothetical protein Q7U04_02595, partial [Bacteriovorax sp.]|nr:hypothetical protein [Bacteriovorax sp.]